jgi:AAA domain (dynein-related subfamily)/EVE domain
MTIPDVSPAAVQEAMDRFDKALRNTPSWANWQQDETYRYAIEQNSRYYPVKQIVSLATGIPVGEFHGGDQANGYVEARGFKVVALPREETRTWIFQANPEVYDVRAAIRKLREIAWTVSRHKEEIAPGDRVYLWESGPLGGIVGVARVVGPVSAGPMPEDDITFWKKKPGKTDLDKAWVELHILGIAEPALERARIASEPQLSHLGILRQPQGTNFSVDKKQAETLEGLLRGRIQQMQPPIDFSSAEVLRQLYDEFIEKDPREQWWTNLTAFLEIIANASETERASLEFQRKLWEENPVSAVGQGFISVDKAIAEQEVRNWIASKSLEKLPENAGEATASLAELADQMVERLRPYCRQIPYLKIFRVLTAFFPEHFTTIADRGKLRDLHVAMFGSTGDPWPPQFETSASHAVKRHANVLARLSDVLGPMNADTPDLVRRITFPWFLYEKLQEQPAPDTRTADAPDQLSALAESLLIERAYLAQVVTLLQKKRQLIFYGPPGTGKTFVARRLGRLLAGDDDRIEIVQFHPSYAYEDFVQGYRPSMSDGQAGFQLVDGALKRLADRARRAPDKTHVLVIDEVNRGNLGKVFGELYYLLEYRNEEISLLYSRESFTLPKNLLIIATMNTADRSIALLDAALRRRFYFVPFFPDEPPIQGLLRRWLQKNTPDLLWLADVVDLSNRKLGDRHIAIGPSYFMDTDLTEEWISLVWKHSIIPYLTEHFFGQEDRLAEFDISKLRESITAQ